MDRALGRRGSLMGEKMKYNNNDYEYGMKATYIERAWNILIGIERRDNSVVSWKIAIVIDWRGRSMVS
jgi:hypothetical protein